MFEKSKWCFTLLKHKKKNEKKTEDYTNSRFFMRSMSLKEHMAGVRS